ncbi:MAG: protein translocase subunit SecD [Treponemataceae bacterium]|nr:protein translocase subunit SecD [Treponemataceae bacterium]
MSKRGRLLLVLAVLGLCFVFLWPTIKWYGLTPKEVQAIALSSLEKIKDYSIYTASEEVNAIFAMARDDSSQPVDEKYDYLVKIAKKNYKEQGKSVPKNFSVLDLVRAFGSRIEIQSVIEDHYREEILDAKNSYANSVKLGLDLSGGMSIVVKADLDAAVANQGDALLPENIPAFKEQIMSNVIETLTSRVDRFGLSEPVIRQQGEDRVYIEMPGAADSSRINSIIMGKGVLTFREVYEAETDAFNEYYLSNPSKVFTANGDLIDLSLIPENAEVLGYYKKDAYGLDERIMYVVVSKDSILDGSHLKSAAVSSDEYGQPEVALVLDGTGTDIFADYTASHQREHVAIVSDNKIKSNGAIQKPIPNGQVAISGGFTLDEAQDLVKTLQSAWLDVPLSVESQQVIGASTGEKQIKEGLFAITFGLLAVMVFMLVWYKGAGVNAVVAQVLNLYIMFSILSAFNLTLTLPSIAGMILTIGMAVDANVIIFERIKDEMKLGKGRAAAIQAGFAHAFWAIMDSNITTFIAALFLSQFGAGSIQGFAVSLSIGVVSSVFTALVVSKLIFDFNTDVLKKQKISITWRKN